MERIDAYQSKSYGPVVLWADDVGEILLAMGQDGAECSIIADNVKYDSVDEYVSELKGRRPRQLELRSTGPFISATFKSSLAGIYAASSKPVALGIYTKIDQIIRGRERKPKIFFNLLTAFMIVIILNFCLLPLEWMLPSYKTWAYTSHFEIFLTIFVAIASVWQLYLTYLTKRSFSTIYPNFRHQKPSFFTANYDKIVLAIICAFLGWFIPFIFTTLMKTIDSDPSPAPPASSVIDRKP
jgi:hypothetical protein